MRSFTSYRECRLPPPPDQAPDHCQVEQFPSMTALSTWQGRVRRCHRADPAPVTNCKQKTIRQVLVTQIY